MHPFITLTRFDKPVGITLLFFPAAWAVVLAAPLERMFPLLALMLVGAAVTRAAGCIINDLADRRLDAQVARTRDRPLAAGTLPLWQACALLMALLLAALLIALILPVSVFYLALVAVPMIAAYPWMKRITWWPQLFLGLTFNLSALFGWLATGAVLTTGAVALYAAAVFWTLGYDTIYAVQDMADDARVGIRSTARLAGRLIKGFVAACYGLMFLLLLVTGVWLQVGLCYFFGVSAVALHLAWQILRLPVEPAHAGAMFRSNQWPGLVLLVFLLLERWT